MTRIDLPQMVRPERALFDIGDRGQIKRAGNETQMRMQFTTKDAVEIYARFCQARFGSKASEEVRNRAKRLQQQGDLDGYKIWNQVAAEIEANGEAPEQRA